MALETPAHLIVDVARLDEEGEDFAGETGDVLGLGSEFIRPLGGIHYDLFAQVLGTELVVRGSLEEDFAAVCSRCAKNFTFTSEVRDYTASFEVDEKTQFVDLTEDLRQSIILALPTYPVCRQDCKGLCPVCGKDLNEGPCHCKTAVADSRWAALDAVRPVMETGKKKR